MNRTKLLNRLLGVTEPPSPTGGRTRILYPAAGELTVGNREGREGDNRPLACLWPWGCMQVELTVGMISVIRACLSSRSNLLKNASHTASRLLILWCQTVLVI